MAWTLYYDGGCNLCHASKLRAEAWAARAGQPLVVAVLQSPAAIAKGYLEADGATQMVLETEDEVLYAADAWLRLMEIAPWTLRWIAFVCRVAPLRRLAKRLYFVVARYRYRWFGTRACPRPGD
ncbi:MAG: DUF393 domain-containing protein [Fimbriimonadaceae bacterium]|nr:DUF393 domain-containing protein [Fimbriimonadaceae bacterium]